MSTQSQSQAIRDCIATRDGLLKEITKVLKQNRPRPANVWNTVENHASAVTPSCVESLEILKHMSSCLEQMGGIGPDDDLYDHVRLQLYEALDHPVESWTIPLTADFKTIHRKFLGALKASLHNEDQSTKEASEMKSVPAKVKRQELATASFHDQVTVSVFSTDAAPDTISTNRHPTEFAESVADVQSRLEREEAFSLQFSLRSDGSGTIAANSSSCFGTQIDKFFRDLDERTAEITAVSNATSTKCSSTHNEKDGFAYANFKFGMDVEDPK